MVAHHEVATAGVHAHVPHPGGNAVERGHRGLGGVHGVPEEKDHVSGREVAEAHVRVEHTVEAGHRRAELAFLHDLGGVHGEIVPGAAAGVLPSAKHEAHAVEVRVAPAEGVGATEVFSSSVDELWVAGGARGGGRCRGNRGWGFGEADGEEQGEDHEAPRQRSRCDGSPRSI